MRVLVGMDKPSRDNIKARVSRGPWIYLFILLTAV